MHSSICSSLRRSHSCTKSQVSLCSRNHLIVRDTHHGNNLPEVAHQFEVSLLVLVSVRHDDLGSLLRETVDEVATKEASAPKDSCDMSRHRRSAK